MDSRRLRPSPSMGVALLALAIALSGTAYAANKIGTNQIKANAVTTAKIKKNAVTTAKIKKNAVTTAKIKKNAVNSSKISDYGTIGNGTAIQATDGPNIDAARIAAPPTTLYKKGPLTIYAKCFRDTVTNQLRGEMFASTTEDFSIMEGLDDLDGGPLATDYLMTNTPEVNRQLDTESVTGLGTNYDEAEGLMAAPGGPAISNLTGIGLKNGPLAANGPYGPGNACIFQGAAFG